MILKEYNKKRDFNKTAEPEGKFKRTEKVIDEKSAKRTYCVQLHYARNKHYDFRLEWKGVLLSWAIPKGPSFNPKDKRLAVKVEDHPLDYRDFEGNIPKGQYGGGAVMLWDEGFWQGENVDKGLKSGVLKFSIFGKRLKGNWSLVKLKAKDNENNWILIKENDEYAKNIDGISSYVTSIKTGRDIQEIEDGKKKKKQSNPFKKVDVQLVQLVSEIPKGKDWMYELKHDGYRIISFVENNTVRLATRNNLDYTDKFPKIVSSLKEIADGRALVLDGEIVIINDDGRSDFSLLQEHLKNKNKYSPKYIVFDLLSFNGEDLRQKQLHERRKIVESIIPQNNENICLSLEIEGSGKEIYKEACKLKAEGIVAKKRSSVYSGNRNGDWVKLKCKNNQEFVIGGYTTSKKKVRGVSSMLLGVYKEKKLVYVGRCGTGLTENDRLSLENNFKKYIQATCPFWVKIKKLAGEELFFMSPKLIAQIEFSSWTKDNMLRHASFNGLRTDKAARDVVKENDKPIEKENKLSKAVAKDNKRNIKIKKAAKIENEYAKKSKEITKNKKTTKILANKTKNTNIKVNKNSAKDIFISGIKITSPDKLVYKNPDIKKLDVLKYYEMVSEKMMPFIKNRIISIKRCPDGVDSTCFFERNYKNDTAGVYEMPIENKEGEKSNYFYVKDIKGLIALAQLNTIEFHTWASSVKKIDFPDIMVFDLDPDENMGLNSIRRGVKDFKSILDGLSLTSFLKTSGGKGYHVVVPFQPKADWEKFYDFAKKVAILMEQKWPERYTSNIRKLNRKNKIFIDWVRNAKTATSIAPYSLRARDGATISMPISWRQLNTTSPKDVNISNISKYLAKPDPWKNFFSTNQSLK